MTRTLIRNMGFRLMGLGIWLGCAACSDFEATSQSKPPSAIDSINQTNSHKKDTEHTRPTYEVRASAVQTVRPSPAAQPLVTAARRRLDAQVRYDGRYVALGYPGGDVPANIGVCTDVVIRSLRTAYDIDLQKTVHEDMKANFSTYPTTWGHRRPDKNIDHRRVPNLEVWFSRKGHALPITTHAVDYQPGDIVSWRLDGNSSSGGLPHIGIVSERLSARGTPLIIHNIGGGPEESDMLFDHRITGHFRLSTPR